MNVAETVVETASSASSISGTITVAAGSSGFHEAFVDIVDDPAQCGVAPLPACGTGAAATALLDPATVVGGIKKFVNSVPLPGPAGANNNDQDPVTEGIQGQYITVGAKEPAAGELPEVRLLRSKSTRDDPRWVHVDVKLVRKTRPILLDELRRHEALADMVILRRGNRRVVTFFWLKWLIWLIAWNISSVRSRLFFRQAMGKIENVVPHST